MAQGADAARAWRPSERQVRWLTWLLLGVILAAIAIGRVAAVGRLEPYSQHVDEAFMTAPVVRMIASGSPNPGTFGYPSLPLYLETGLMLASAQWQPEGVLDEIEVAKLGLAHTPAGPYHFTRVFFALISVATL
jgi:hypothetical protein